jgi:superfamily II DNA/RNA helicase
MSFENLNLNAAILKAIAETGYTEPTPIQAQAIPEIMAGNDLMASSQTGSGKTAAFILPSLNRLATPSALPGKGPRVLVLTPTRELAQQVCDAATKYGKNMRFKIISILGGMPYPVQNRLLSSHVDILVATPGRLIDHLERGRIDFSRLEVLILDEADRMLDMGFVDDVERIAKATPATRQTLLFSATLDGVVGNLASRLLKTPKKISVSAAKDKHENIEQRMMFADDVAHKNKMLSHLLTDAEMNQALVFTATKRDADSIADQLSAQGHSVAALHGDMNQRERNRTLLNMRNGNVRILVATDVAARGLDVRGISHVINFDLPKFAEDYVHRIGRTGRGGSSGIAISFASNRDAQSKASRCTPSKDWSRSTNFAPAHLLIVRAVTAVRAVTVAVMVAVMVVDTVAIVQADSQQKPATAFTTVPRTAVIAIPDAKKVTVRLTATPWALAVRAPANRAARNAASETIVVETLLHAVPVIVPVTHSAAATMAIRVKAMLRSESKKL